jgi:hypothetical protein
MWKFRGGSKGEPAKFPARLGHGMCNTVRRRSMVRKLMMTTAAVFVGAALLALPTSVSYAGGMDEMSSQAGTKGAGAARTGVGTRNRQGQPQCHQ